MGTLAHDVRVGLRALRQRPSYALVLLGVFAAMALDCRPAGGHGARRGLDPGASGDADRSAGGPETRLSG